MEQPKDSTDGVVLSKKQKEKLEYDQVVKTFPIDKSRKEIAIKMVMDTPLVRRGTQPPTRNYRPGL